MTYYIQNRLCKYVKNLFKCFPTVPLSPVRFKGTAQQDTQILQLHGITLSVQKTPSNNSKQITVIQHSHKLLPIVLHPIEYVYQIYKAERRFYYDTDSRILSR